MSIAVSRRGRGALPRLPAFVEALESRQLLSLVEMGDVVVTLNHNGTPSTYTAETQTLTFNLLPVAVDMPSGSGMFSSPYALTVAVQVDADGNVVNGNLLLNGKLELMLWEDDFRFENYSGNLLAGEVLQGSFVGTTRFEAVFDLVELPDSDGSSFSNAFFSGKKIGLTLDLVGGTFAGSFNEDFIFNATGKLGPVNFTAPPPPTQQDPQPPTQDPQTPQQPEVPPPMQDGVPLRAGQTAGIGFWRNKQGQKLLVSAKPGLGNWMAQSWPNLFGNLAGKSNAQVAELYKSHFAKWSVMKLKAQMMATAFSVYVTTQDLGGSAAAKFGFNVSPAGTGAALINVGASGRAFGVANNAPISVNAALDAANDVYKRFTTRFHGPTRGMLHDVFGRINEAGSIA